VQEVCQHFPENKDNWHDKVQNCDQASISYHLSKEFHDTHLTSYVGEQHFMKKDDGKTIKRRQQRGGKCGCNWGFFSFCTHTTGYL
jgi:hypothetical protein